jgi:hypothetical protein
MDSGRPREMKSPFVLDVRSKDVKPNSCSKNFLDRSIVIELPSCATAIIKDWVSPLVVDMIGVKVRRDVYAGYTALSSNFFHALDSSLTLKVVCFTDGGTVLEVIPAIRPESTFDDVMRIKLSFRGLLCGLATEHTFVVVTLEDSLSKVVTR